MKKLVLSLVAAMSMAAAHAVPAINTPLTFTQSDGSTITVRLVGDERFSTYTTMDGLTIERSETGDFYYKTSKVVSKIMAHNQDARTQAELNYITANASEMTVQSIAPANMGGKNKARKAPAMMATAADSLSDSIATAAVLLATFVAHWFNLNIDGWIGVVVAGFILWAGYNAAKDTISPLLGQAPDPELVRGITETVLSFDHIVSIHDMVVHDYGPGKTVIFIVFTVVGAMVIIFLILAFFSLLSDAAAFFISLVREIMFRLY